MTKDPLEQQALGWLASVGFTQLNDRDPDLDPLGKSQALASSVT
ncbi:hypothetical protein [Limnohabitans sp. WS1]|nr:hypothetical protein [Limnohabitans sp. WS1]